MCSSDLSENELEPLIFWAEVSLCGTALGRATAADAMSHTASPVRVTIEPRHGNLRTDETLGFGIPCLFVRIFECRPFSRRVLSSTWVLSGPYFNS